MSAALTGAAAVALVWSAVTRADRGPRRSRRPRSRLARSMTLIVRNRLVALIALVVVVGEVFGVLEPDGLPDVRPGRPPVRRDRARALRPRPQCRRGHRPARARPAAVSRPGRAGCSWPRSGSGVVARVFAVSSSFVLSVVLLLAVGAGGRPRHARPVAHPAQRRGPRARIGDGGLVLRHRVRPVRPPRARRRRGRLRGAVSVAISGGLLALTAAALSGRPGAPPPRLGPGLARRPPPGARADHHGTTATSRS